MVFNPIKLDRKEGKLYVRGVEYSVLSGPGGYLTCRVSLDNLIEAHVHTGQIPQDVSIVSSLEKPLPVGATLAFKRNEVTATIYTSRWDRLVPEEDFLTHLAAKLQSQGWSLLSKHVSSLKLILNGERILVDDVVESIEESIEETVEYVETAESSLKSFVDNWVKWINEFDGRSMAESLKLHYAFKMIVMALFPAAVAKLLFGMDLFDVGKNVENAILKDFNAYEGIASQTLCELGLVRIQDSSRVPTPLARYLADKIIDAARRGLGRKSVGKSSIANPIELLSFIRRNIRSVAAQNSKTLRQIRKRREYKSRLREIEDRVKALTFAHIVALTMLSLGREPEQIFVKETEDLINMGFVSQKGKLRRYGIWVLKLVKSYLRRKAAKTPPELLI